MRSIYFWIQGHWTGRRCSRREEGEGKFLGEYYWWTWRVDNEFGINNREWKNGEWGEDAWIWVLNYRDAGRNKPASVSKLNLM